MRALREYCLSLGIPALWDAPMSDYTSFRIGGAADALLFPETEESLEGLLIHLSDGRLPYRVIGNATNLLVSDDGYRGALITTRRLRSVTVGEDGVRAAAGTPVNTLCRALADHSLGGMECLYGIPGTVGGAIVMNAGAYGGTVSDLLSAVTVYDRTAGRVAVLSRAACGFGYRQSIFREQRDVTLLSAEFLPKRALAASIRQKMREILAARTEKQPTSLPSAGSAFLRPEGAYAGRLIEEAGLVGLSVGGAAVSIKHAGFIVNLGDATARDVLSLISLIQQRVYTRTGILLKPEIEYIEA